MEEEAREILKLALSVAQERPRNLADTIRKRFAAFGGVELPIPPRQPMRPVPDFR